MSSFTRMSKMDTTEPTVDEVKMKRGGAAKKHMAIGGALPVAAAPAMPVRASMPTRPMMARSPIARPTPMIPVMGRKKGGVAHKAIGGLAGSGEVDDYKSHGKGKTGDVEGAGYKRGGKLKKAIGGKISEYANTKVDAAKQEKSITSKTGGVEGAGYKRGGALKKNHYAKGGSVAEYENTKMDEKEHSQKRGTGSIKQDPAGYKSGGSVHHGHKSMSEHVSEHSHGHGTMKRKAAGGSVKKCW